MITLLATLAWGQSSQDDVEPEHRGGGRVALGALEGALIGGGSGWMLGMGAAVLWVELDDCTDCDGTAAGLMPLGAMIGIPVGALVGGTIAANRVKHQRQQVAVQLIRPGVPGIGVRATW